MRLLFICSQNRLRSPTAETVFGDWPGMETASAGLNRGVEVPVSPELLEWADLIFVMETAHRNRLSRHHQEFLRGKRVICLNIADEYDYMQPELISLLESRVSPHLRPFL